MREIERLTAELERLDPSVRATAEALMRSVMELHADAFGRIVKIARARGAVDDLVQDDLLSHLLLLYDLHPVPLETRIRKALDRVRPYIASHGGGIELAAIEGDVVRVRMEGSCDGCPSSSSTMKLAVEEAVLEAAPEIAAVIADQAAADASAGSRSEWTDLPSVHSLPDGGGRTVDLHGRSLLVCRLGESFYAYGNQCPGCRSALEPAQLSVGFVSCPVCGRRYDVKAAGRDLNDAEVHLEPFPLLIENGRARVALPSS